MSVHATIPSLRHPDESDEATRAAGARPTGTGEAPDPEGREEKPCR